MFGYSTFHLQMYFYIKIITWGHNLGSKHMGGNETKKKNTRVDVLSHTLVHYRHVSFQAIWLKIIYRFLVLTS